MAEQPHHHDHHNHTHSGHIVTIDEGPRSFQPMNINFGLFPPLPEVSKKARKEAYTDRAKADLGAWMAQRTPVPA